MARINTDWMIEEYTDDFGRKYKNVFFKIQNGAPKLDSLYKARPAALSCGGGLIFKPRALVVTFGDGRTLRYPVAAQNKIDDIVKELLPSAADNLTPGTGADEAVCINLDGEEWSLVPGSIFGGLSFKTTPYNNIPNRGKKETGTYSYQSDVDGLGKLTLGYSVEELPADLANCQKAGMAEIKSGRGICSASALGIDPRHFVIQALWTADDNSILPGGKAGGNVRRRANVSGYDENILPGSKKPQDVAKEIDKCAYCLGWKGESIRNLHNLVSGTNLLG
jgi:hypothetical protein